MRAHRDLDVLAALIAYAHRVYDPDRTAIEPTTVATTLETTSDTSQGVMVECYREGGTLRVRVVSPGYNQSWHCQFPKDIREAGARFMVDEVREAVRGGFYRVLGNIRKLA